MSPMLYHTPITTPFGMQISDRTWSSSEYRYGFNGKEKDEDGEFGSVTNYDFGARIYNPSIGRWLTVDKYSKAFPSNSPYVFGINSPIVMVDPDGNRTDYYSASGRFLFSSDDKLIDAVVIIDESNLQPFLDAMQSEFQGVEYRGQIIRQGFEALNSDASNRLLREYGQAYDGAGFISYFEDHENDVMTEEEWDRKISGFNFVDEKGNRIHMVREATALLVQNDEGVYNVLETEDILKANEQVSDFDSSPRLSTTGPEIHTHPLSTEDDHLYRHYHTSQTTIGPDNVSVVDDPSPPDYSIALSKMFYAFNANMNNAWDVVVNGNKEIVFYRYAILSTYYNPVTSTRDDKLVIKDYESQEIRIKFDELFDTTGKRKTSSSNETKTDDF